MAGNVASETQVAPGYASGSAHAQSDSGTWVYNYDGANRLTQAKDPGGAFTSYYYDGSGSMCGRAPIAVSASPTCSSPSGIAGATTYSYDNAGYLKTSAAWTGPSSSTTTSYTTNPMGELTTMNTNGVTTTYVFDPAGHRVSAQVPSGSGAGTYSYSWDGLGRMLSDSKTGGATTSFSYVGSGFDPSVITAGSSSTYLAYSPQGPLAQKQGSSVSYLATNLHGDVIGLASNGSPPTISSTVAYDPWGAPRPGYTPGSMLGYQGDPTDPATGDVNMQHRLYTRAWVGSSPRTLCSVRSPTRPR